MNRVRVRRKALGLTQEQLAEKVERDQRTISGIEVGGARPSFELAQALAVALDCSLDELFGESVAS